MCGATNPDRAAWCSQCHRRFDAGTVGQGGSPQYGTSRAQGHEGGIRGHVPFGSDSDGKPPAADTGGLGRSGRSRKSKAGIVLGWAIVGALILGSFILPPILSDDDSKRQLAPSAPRRCDPSYPSVCIPPPPPDLDCADISYSYFLVFQPDPHFFDRDFDGLGCEIAERRGGSVSGYTGLYCDSSYPTECIPPPPPDLDCSDIDSRFFVVLWPDPHDLDADGDGIGCEFFP